MQIIAKVTVWVAGRERQRSVGLCECGKEVTLVHALVNTCECGRDYNMSGQLLAPRIQWGEDTGESPAEILGFDAEIEMEAEDPGWEQEEY